MLDISELKYEHIIYKKDFDCSHEFHEEINILIDMLEEKKKFVNNLINKDYQGWNNSDSKKLYDDIIEFALEEIESTISKLESYKGEII